MRLPRPSRGLLWLLVLSTCASDVTAAAARVRRQEGQTTSSSTISDLETTPSPTSTSSTAAEEEGETTVTSPTITSSTTLPTPTETISTDDATTTTLFYPTIPPGHLPLSPALTPAFALTGSLLLPASLAYLSLAHPRIRIFLSAALPTALAATLLVLYLAVPPVPAAVQAGYVLAAAGGASVLGGMALLLRVVEVAECAGCVLGGFCLGMWLLTVKEGGLVPGKVGKVVVLAVLSVLAGGLYVVKKIRKYVLAGCVGFAGATGVVLAIDCFARPGLKEFWAWLWGLNEGLFPLGAYEGGYEYPLNRGIRVELAATVILAVAGAAAHLRLWRRFGKKREEGGGDGESRGAGERSVADPSMVRLDEESVVGQRAAETAERERREWEHVYDEGAGGLATTASADSGVGGIRDKEKKLGYDAAAKTVAVSPSTVELDGQSRAPWQDDGMFVDAAQIGIAVGDERSEDGARHQESTGAMEEDKSRLRTESPPIVPLPFQVPVPSQRRRGSGSEDGSSVIAMPDDELDGRGSPQSDNAEAAVWLSEKVSTKTTGTSVVSGTDSVPYADSETDKYGPLSSQARVLRDERDTVVVAVLKDESESVVATLDDQSDTEDADTAILFWSPSLKPQKNPTDEIPPLDDQEAEAKDTTSVSSKPDQPADQESSASRSGEDAPDIKDEDETPGTDHVATEDARETTKHSAAEDEASPDSKSTSHSSKSAESQASTVRLTKTNLPPPLPEVALTYRTNEWAKHLDLADAPDPAALAPEVTPDVPDEEPAHLDLVDLRLTAENATPPRIPSKAAKRLSSATALAVQNQPPPSRPTSTLPPPQRHAQAETMAALEGKPRNLASPLPVEPYQTNLPTTSRLSTATLTPDLSHPVSTPNYSHPYSQNKSQTLLGMREQILRSRASAIHGTPTGGSGSSSSTHLSPGQPQASYQANLRFSSPSSSSLVSRVGTSAGVTTATATATAAADRDLLDDLPLSQRRTLIRQGMVPAPLRTSGVYPSASGFGGNGGR
ncbi:hypothetical protein VTJ49DRAFT_2176 [Mycothermus thermophilus]|uniref:TM7S3/TM198-like domain-containing protein n=1 Tax=Humicola insolens TaxID=85995 RepID=A0ABR3VAJ8_HUMIN